MLNAGKNVFIDNNSVVHNFTQAQLSDRFIGSIFYTQVINWMTLVCVISSDNHNSHLRDTKIVYIPKLNWMLALVSFPVKTNRLPWVPEICCNVVCYNCTWSMNLALHQCRVQILPNRSSIPWYWYMHTWEGCGLGPHVIPYIQNALLEPEQPINISWFSL